MPPFLPVRTRATIAQEALHFALSQPPSAWTAYYSFDGLLVPPEIIEKDPFLTALARIRDFRTGIIRLPAQSCYNWHVDSDRNATINMILQTGVSHCLFLDGEFGLTVRVKELKYQPNTYYVFNTQCLHIVANLEGDRYMLTLEFQGKDKAVTFDALCADIRALVG